MKKRTSRISREVVDGVVPSHPDDLAREQALCAKELMTGHLAPTPGHPVPASYPEALNSLVDVVPVVLPVVG